MDYLITSDGQKIELRANEPYQNVWALHGYLGFFMAKDSVVEAKTDVASQDKLWCLRDGRDAKDFANFFNSWKTATGATLYRGLPGCHRSWRRLRTEGVLESEGDNDIPMATMSNDQPSCWLPSVLDLGTAQNVALSCMAKAAITVMTYLRLMHGPGIHVRPNRFPAGIILKIPVRVHGPIWLCWLNRGETILKGPLNSSQFSIHEIAWLLAGGLEFTPTILGPLDLFPERPYEPENKDWFADWRRSNPANDSWLKQTAVR